MPPLISEFLTKALSFVKDMAANLTIIYTEKGIDPFKKPLMMAVPALFILYLAANKPLATKLTASASEFGNLTLVAQHADEYLEAKSRLGSLKRKLPLLKDKDDWINYVITTSARAYGISFDSLSGQNELEVGDYLVVSREVTVTTTYDMLGRWLADIENSPIFLRVVQLRIGRDQGVPGGVKVTFTLSTIFSKGEGRDS